MDPKMLNVLQGRLDDLPQVQSQLVRVFTSSTFTDTYTERNFLIENIYPKLKEYCKNKYDIDFQVVDMRWGVRDEASDDHATSGLCLEEIENCQKLSAGPNFVAFLGQRYGYRPIPSKINCDEFEKLTTALEETETSVDILKQWYWKDENEIPSVYVLQRISSIMPDFISMDEGKRKMAKQEWSRTFICIQESLRTAASICNKRNIIDESTRHRYFMSVTESEIQSGILNVSESVSEHCLGFVRIINDIEENLQHPLAWRFIDMDKDSLNTDAQVMMNNLRGKKLPEKLGEANIIRSSVSWDSTSGISSEKHSDYLQNFGEQFYMTMINKIDKAISHNKHLEENKLFMEVIQHAKLARDRYSLFHGREDILGSIQNLVEQNNNEPIVVYGQSGCGKTSVMAMCAKEISTWVPNGQKGVIILRFLGTTPASTTIMQLLTSICEQIAFNYNQKVECEDNLNDLTLQFYSLLTCATTNKPLIIMLDSLDQLTSANYAHKLVWLKIDLPDNVYLIVSTLPSLYNIWNTLKRKKIKDRNFIRIQSLGDKLGLQILDTWLNKSARKLSPQQYSLVQDAFSKCSLPLFVRLLYEEVLLWKSYYPASQLQLSFTIRNVINDLFTRLEKKHGLIFVSHSLAYITASKGGLSEMEIEDVLSLDDEVLTDVFQYHVPPVRRIPQLLIIRLQYDVRQYLVSREADGVMVTYWYHRQFIEASLDRYMKNSAFLKDIHKSIAEFFMGIWHGTEKPYIYTAAQMRKRKVTSSDAKADRKVMAQPLFYVDESEVENLTERYNTRKLSNLPYHLSKAGMNDYILEYCLLNYDWLRAKTRAFSLREALSDYAYISSSRLCTHLVQSLNLSTSTLNKYPKTLGSELLARLTYVIGESKLKDNHLLQKMLLRCIKHGSKENKLLPKGQIFAEIDERLKYTLEYPNLPSNGKIVCFSPDSFSLYATTNSNEMVVWDLQNGEVEKQFQLWPYKDPKLNVSHISRDKLGDNRYLIVATCYQNQTNPVVVVDLVQGEIIYAVKLIKHYPKLAFKESVQLEMIDDNVLMNIVGDECSLYSLDTGEVIHTYPYASTMMNVSHDKKSVIFYVMDSSCFKVMSLFNMDEIASIKVDEPPPLKLLTTSDVTFAVPKAGKCITLWDFDVKKGGSPKNLASLTLDKYLENHNVMDASLSFNQQLLVITYIDGIVLWNIKSNKFVERYEIPEICKPHSYNVSQFQAALTCDNLNLVVSYEDFIILWSLKSNEVYTMNLANTTNPFTGIIMSPNLENPVAVTIIKGAIQFQVLDLSKFHNKNTKRWTPQLKMSSGVRYIAIAQNCSRFICLSFKPDNIFLVNAIEGEVILSDFQKHEVTKPHLSPDGRFIVLMRKAARVAWASLDFYNADNGKLICSLDVDSTRLRTYCFSSDGTRLVTHCEDSPNENVELAVWKVEPSVPKINVMKTDIGGISYLEYVYNDKLIATLQQYPQLQEGKNCKLRIFDAETGEQLHISDGITADGMYIVLGKPFLYIIKAGTTNLEYSFCEFDLNKLAIVKQHNIRPIRKLTLTQCGTYGVDIAIQVFNLQEGKLLHCFGNAKKPMVNQHAESYPRLSNDGAYVVWLDLNEASVNLGNVATKSIVGKIFTHSMPTALRVTCDNIVVVGTDEGYIMLYNIVDGTENMDQLCDSILQSGGKSKNGQSKKTISNKDKSPKSSGMCTVL